ncbi:hypothetical protein HN371_02570 [Candidatus Poribacteria bacterium]|nr:hypothetical protein [Candidatus Poribacteria bacterium]MBT5535831.1 hypothetical protein [Candidatus Poribacteria bacterium]MBT5714472.1 hypothetical protein [Candidatus Poribacteria bacterium]MBT7101495.1 hypothetical protein [Candidatus Poribacteria bacterium]MBT7806547.1 hypothetical protein [Candidatus Poribacteria bacterium]
MAWYESKPVSGRWGWHWTMNHFDPEQVDSSGRRDIASHHYPIVGPYDSTDPDLLSYHFLLMKVAGIDGVIIDWYGAEDIHDYAFIDRAAEAAIDAADACGLQYAICYEDRTLRAMVNAGRIEADGAVDQARREMRHLEENWFAREGYLRIDGRPALLVFGPEYLSDAQWEQTLGGMSSDPAFLTLHQRRAPADGLYAWPPMWASEDGVLTPDRLREYFARYGERASEARYSIAAAFPGFRDIYAEAGAQESHGVLRSRDDATFDETLRLAMASGADAVQLVTWNDFGEGTVIEPTREFGYRYLERVQEARRELDDAPFPYTTDDLRLPARIYGLRKLHAKEDVVLDALRAAEEAARRGSMHDAREGVDAIDGQR